MSDADKSWSYLNAGPNAITVWLEPWAEEFEVPCGSTILLRSPEGSALGSVERDQDSFTLWAAATKVEVLIDGILQDTASSQIAVPEGLTKAMLTAVFGNYPEARLGGKPLNPNVGRSIWSRAKSLLGL
jgi:hypothetical protein